MKNLKKLLMMLLVCSLVGSVIGCSSANKTAENESVVETTSEEETEEETLPLISQPTYEIPTVTAVEEKTFASDEETYKYAVSQMNEGKYYLAVKYLRKIPNYKDSASLLNKLFAKMSQNYITFDEIKEKCIATKGMNATALASSEVLKRKDYNIVDEQVIQRFEYGYIDVGGNLKMATDDVPKDIYNKVFVPLMEYNRTMKFKKVLIAWGMENAGYMPYYVNILTDNNEVVRFTPETNEKEVYKGIIEGEKAIDLNGMHVLSDKGNVYKIDYSGAVGAGVLQVLNDVSDVVALSQTDTSAAQGLYEGNSVVGVDVNGHIVADKAMMEVFPVLKSWSDIVSVELSLRNEFYGYCMGLTSAGEVLVAYQGGVTTLKPFDATKKYVAITCFNEKMMAITDGGDICVETMPTWADKNSGTIEIPQYQSELPEAGTDKTFASDTETYNYAKTCFDEGKYIEAIKYLRKIPDYKDTESLMDKVYRYINSDFVDVASVRFTPQDKIFTYNDKKITDTSNRQSLESCYIDANGEFHYKGGDQEHYYKKLVEHNSEVKFKMISTTGEYGWSDFNITYLLTEAGKIERINSKALAGATGFDEVDMSNLSEGERVVYISGNAALSDKGYVYYIVDLKLVKDKNLSDIAAIKSGCGVLMAITEDGKIVYNQPEGWKIPLTLSVLSDVVSVDMCLENRIDAGYFAALKSDGTVVVVRRAGAQVFTELPKDKKYVSVAFSYRLSECRLIALTAEGEIYVAKLD